ncbi:MAG: hypothetical protein PVJ01_00120 [Pseudomonadota bacterium]|jgi:hypothetical protein
MPGPKYLLDLKASAERALNTDPPDGLTGFCAAWMLFEAVRRRILLLSCKREGWTVDQARHVLLGERIDNHRFMELYRIINNGETWEESMPLEAGKLWPHIGKAVDLRKRIIHGTSRIGQENLQKEAWNVLRFINRLNGHPLGDPLRELPKMKKKTRSDQSLKERIKKQ